MRASDEKGQTRIEMVEMLDAAIARGLRVTSGRASDYFGPNANTSTITAVTVEPTAAGKTPRWMGRTDVPHSVAYLPDVARAYVVLGTDDRADGSHWVLPHTGAPTGAEFLDGVTDAAGLERSNRSISKAMLSLAAPFHRMSREALGISYQWYEPFVADSSRFEATFGPFTVTPLDRAIAEALGTSAKAVA